MGHFFNWVALLVFTSPVVLGRSARVIFRDEDEWRTGRDYVFNPQQPFVSVPAQPQSYLSAPAQVGYSSVPLPQASPLQSSVVYSQPIAQLQQSSSVSPSYESISSGILDGAIQGQLYPVSDVNILNPQLRPRKRYKIVFVKAPIRPAPQIIVSSPPKVTRKTIVYVLSEKQKPPKITSVGGPAGPSEPTKPEVFFIRYDANDGSRGEIASSNIGATTFTSPSYGKTLDGQTYKTSSY